MKKKRIYIRSDASVRIGTGHIRRCLVVAEKLKNQGHDVVFLCRDHVGHLQEFIKNQGFICELLHLPYPEADKDALDVYQLQDAQLSVEKSSDADVYFIDHYALDRVWEGYVKEKTSAKIVVFDDLVNRFHDCDAFIDYTPIDRNFQQYLSVSTETLLGVDYVILRDEFLQEKQNIKPDIKENPENILIFLGGNDPDNVTGFVLNILSKEQYKNFNITVIAGATCPHIQELQSLVDSCEKMQMIVQCNDMAKQLLWADIVIGSGGTNTWERMFFGCPTIVFELASNQKPICNYLINNDIAVFGGAVGDLNEKKFIKTFDKLVGDVAYRRRVSEKTKIILDGMGAERIACEVIKL